MGAQVRGAIGTAASAAKAGHPVAGRAALTTAFPQKKGMTGGAVGPVLGGGGVAGPAARLMAKRRGAGRSTIGGR